MASNQLGVLLSAFALLGSIGLVVVLLLGWGWAARAGNRRLVRGARFGVAGVAAGYLVALLGFGLQSHDTVLPAGCEKYFCEIDCHLAYRVLEARRVTAPGTGAAGARWAVALQTRFDETTISARRSRVAPLWPAPRHVALRDESGRWYESLAGSEAWRAGERLGSTPLTRPVRPGDSYRTALLFDLPAGAAPSALLVENAGWINRLLIGDERSPWHGKRLLPVPPAAS